MDRSGPVRLLRSASITGAILSLAAGAHLVAGEKLPPAAVMLGLTALLLLTVTWLARRQLSFAALMGILVAGQVVLHEAFTALTVTGACRSLPRAHGTHGAVAELHCPESAPSVMAHETFGDASSLLLLGAHLAAVVLTAWMMRRGESALWLLVAWLRPLMSEAIVVVILPRRRRSFICEDAFLPSPWRNLRSDSRRGPPSAPALSAEPA